MNQSQIEEIGFGNGGGFTGAVTSYVLTKDGNLFSENAFTEERSLIKKIDTSVVDDLFQFAESSDLLSFRINKPGNTYKYVDFNIAGTHLKSVWTGKSENKSLNLLYAQLKDLCQIKE
ncbi:hypothetical protein GCM10007940_38790 [Portibacter lacus]|uniref:Uncharacterized protein n=2 Tax=Portibacter lacus TaxID=1099794 RepID=A0AA37SWR6_9BACT|nr:hypothetical protein GCM10007940_38790 [Portibacter lacus]